MRKELTPMEVILCVCDTLGVTPKEIIAKVRIREISDARHIAMSLVNKVCKISEQRLTLSQIAALFSRNHATVIYAIKESEKLIAVNKLFFKKYFDCMRKVESLLASEIDVSNMIEKSVEQIEKERLNEIGKYIINHSATTF
jgi:hypothetical protein